MSLTTPLPADRIREYTLTSGTGDLALAGAVDKSFFSFASAYADSQLVPYCIEDTGNGVSEWGIGTYHAGNTLSRTLVLGGSNGAAPVNLKSGQKVVFVTYLAERAVSTDAPNTFTAGPQTIKKGGLLVGDLAVHTDPYTIAAFAQVNLTINDAALYNTDAYFDCCDVIGNVLLAANYPNLGINGLSPTIQTDPTHTHSLFSIGGQNLAANHRGTGAIHDIVGGHFSAHNSDFGVGGGAVTNLIAGRFVYASGGSGTCTNGYGIVVEDPANDISGPITNAYGIFIQHQSQGTNRWQLYSAGNEPSYFAGQIGIGQATPNAAAAVQIDSTTQGFLPPRMTTTQRNAISTPPEGLMIWNSTTHKLDVYNGSAWQEVTAA